MTELRFEFGRNWHRLVQQVDERRIANAADSLRRLTGIEAFDGLSFVDVGSGSGLFSLAASRMGARVHSFDFDLESVKCTETLRARFAPAAEWTIERGSALDADYLRRLGAYDLVYSWGVLHHTGDMWRAIDLVTGLVAARGRLVVALYNDQGLKSRVWYALKAGYNMLPSSLRPIYSRTVRTLVGGATRLRRPATPPPKATTPPRGMDTEIDWLDWIGGFPFEVASPRAVTEFLGSRGFTIERTFATTSLGCNEFVFRRD